MKRLIQQLQRHPLVVLGMFVVSAVSGLMGIVLGWKQFYSAYLSQAVQLPVWLLLLLSGLALVVYFVRPAITSRTRELEVVQGQTFGVQPVDLDGKRFVNCIFDGSELVFRGSNGFDLVKNDFRGAPRIRFEGSAANTLAALKAMHSDPVFRQFVLATFPTKAGADAGA